MKRVFVLTSRSFLGHGIQDLLHKESTIDIIGRDSDVGRAVACIERLQPDVVIFDSHDLTDKPLQAMIKVLRTNPNIKGSRPGFRAEYVLHFLGCPVRGQHPVRPDRGNLNSAKKPKGDDYVTEREQSVRLYLSSY